MIYMQEYSHLRINNNAGETIAHLVGEKNECVLPSCVRRTQWYDKASICWKLWHVYLYVPIKATFLHCWNCEKGVENWRLNVSFGIYSNFTLGIQEIFYAFADVPNILFEILLFLRQNPHVAAPF
jgi:hypothetical protein